MDQPGPALWQLVLFAACDLLMIRVAAQAAGFLYFRLMPAHRWSGGISASMGCLLFWARYAVIVIGLWHPQRFGPISTWAQAVTRTTLVAELHGRSRRHRLHPAGRS